MKSFLLLLFTPLLAFGQPDEIRALIANTYNFLPTELSKEQHAAKVSELDHVWDVIRSAGDEGLVILRQELSAENANRYFYFDGASLLITISKQKNDVELAIRAIQKADFEQLDWREYFDVVRNLARKGGNVVPIALRILENPKYRIFVPQHALTVEPDFAIIYMVKDVPAADSTPLLMEAFEKETDPEKRKFILTALWYNLDERGFTFIDSLRSESVTSTALRERVVEFQKRNRMAGSGGIFGGSFETINKRRLAVLDRLSDEALDEYEDLTKRALGKMKRSK